MNRLDLMNRVRSLTRDLSNSIFRDVDVSDYINEGIYRCRQLIPELKGMSTLKLNTDTPDLLPEEYHYLLAIYSASRCFNQDERHYQATNFMNEFEIKLEEMKMRIESGEVIITDGNGNAIEQSYEPVYVKDVYFSKSSESFDLDDGVEGVE